jgi:hypothetical protein
MSLTKVTYSMIDGGFANVKDFGASPSATAAENTTAFQAAVAYAAPSGLQIVIPEGTYLLDPSQTVTALGVTKYCVFVIQNDLHMVGLGSVTLKIKNGFSTTASPKDFFIGLSTSDNENVSFENITFDMNGHNNLIAVKPSVPAPPTAPGTTWGILLTSALAWLTTSATPTVGSVDGLLISNCHFTGTPGTNNLVLGTSIVFGATPIQNKLSNNVTITGCKFSDSGFNTSDFTCIYGWANNMLLEKTRFDVADDMDNPMTGTPVEVHGGNSIVRQCEMVGFQGGVLIADNAVEVTRNVSVYSNYIEAFANPIYFFRDPTAGYPTGLEDVFVYDNTLRLTTGIALNNLKFGVSMDVDRGVRNIFIYNNSINNAQGNAVLSRGIFLGASNPLESLIADQIFVTGNSISFFSNGIECFIGSGGLGGGTIGQLYIKDNSIFDCTVSDLSTGGIGIYFLDSSTSASVIDYLQISNNHISSEANSVYLNNPTIGLYYYDSTNVFQTLDANPYLENSVVVTSRLGTIATISYATTIPVAGTWRRGDIVYNSTPSAGGTIGWVCTTAGTPGTWKTFGAIAA